ncbi:hypothetical protein C5167_033231 [Papaver somniferum]|uniref:Uncharacterized protein n=1 Tax=Papaver somniferum TaxID=3469 RepID=A0A4Y7KCC8_PAPSO|nr:hypothetical protein C5167_033231 [Papaver somniferum]
MGYFWGYVTGSNRGSTNYINGVMYPSLALIPLHASPGPRMSDENIGHMIQDQLEDGTLTDGATVNRLLELTNCTEEGSSQLAGFVKKWEYC